jgi:hypothetical protein
MNVVQYLNTYWAPLLILAAGSVLVAVFLYLHLLKKQEIVRWMAKYIFGNQMMAEKSAEGLFNVATSFVVSAGGLWIILAIYYLTNG